jgi:hypothetical protein
MQPTSKVFHNCQEQITTQTIIDHGKIIDYTTYHVCQDIIVGGSRWCCYIWWWWTHRRGVEPIRGDFDSVSLLQTPSAIAFYFYISLFSISMPPCLENAQGTLFIVIFRSSRREPRENRRHQALKAETRPGGATPLVLIPSPLTSWCSTLAHFVRLEISMMCSVTVFPFSSLISPRKLKTLNKAFSASHS